MHKIAIFIAKPPKNHVVKNRESKTTALKTNTSGCVSVCSHMGAVAARQKGRT